MSQPRRNNRILFDLNHPADFHFFSRLFTEFRIREYPFRVVARDKECLHELLQDAGIPFLSRGKGSRSRAGKYACSLWIILRLMAVTIRFRPGLTLSLSSPYLTLVSRAFRIPAITYDDTDINPRLLPLIRRADVVLSPATYPHKFHKRHFRIDSFKELAYIPSVQVPPAADRKSVFFRLTRPYSIHHSGKQSLPYNELQEILLKISATHHVFVSNESPKEKPFSKPYSEPDRIHIHRDLSKCSAFWGNSATMAAEAALMGIPSVYIGNEKFAYIAELEKAGLLYSYGITDYQASFDKLEEIIQNLNIQDLHQERKEELIRRKIDITGLLLWLIENLPQSVDQLIAEPDYQYHFRLPDGGQVIH